MCDLLELPFNNLVSDEEFCSALSSLRYHNNNIDFDKLTRLKLNIFDTNIKDNVNIPSFVQDPDNNCNLYKQLSNELTNVCDYHIIENFALKAKKFSSQELSIMHHNVRSLPSHSEEFVLYLKSMVYPFKIIGLSETWLKPSNHELYNFDGYHSLHKTRINRNGGGVSLLVDNSVKYVERNDFACLIEDVAESVFIEIDKTVFKTEKKLIIGEIYKPPNSCIESFTLKVECLLKKLDEENALCYLMGDFNINLINAEKHSATNDFLDSMFSFGYVPLINRPTRVTEYTATLIDHIYTNAIDTLDPGRYLNGIVYCEISDHFPVFHICKSLTKLKSGKTIVYRQQVNERNLSRMKQEVEKINWDDVYNEVDANNGYDTFIDKFDKLYKKCIPVKKCVMKAHVKPWITECILNSVKRKNKLYYMYIKHPCPATAARYKAYRNKLNHVLRVSQRKYIHDRLSQYNCDMKRSWKIINNVIDSKSRFGSLPDSVWCDEGIISDPVKIASHFNEYFTNIGPKLANSLSKTNVNPVDYIRYQGVAPISISLVENVELLKVLEELKDTSPGHDGFQAKVLRYVKSEITKPLGHILNLSLRQGIFPDKLKHAIVSPIYKSGERTKVENYRPVSVLSVFSKVYERVMYNRLLPYLEINKILYKHQYGFRPGFSTDQALVHVVDNILQALDKKEHLVGVYMDLAKAFDTINHKILLSKLSQYGIQDVGLLWLRSYLTNRYQQVKYNGVLSEERKIVCGVPQGSLLGPLLFILYINDIHNCCEDLTLILFADDTNAFIKGSDINVTIDSLNANLAKIAEWFDANQLSLNIKKTHYMIFSNKSVLTSKVVQIKGTKLEQVSSTKFLGVFIDHKLTWKEHITYTKNKISKCIGILRKVNKILSKCIKLKLYKTFIQPHLIYCNIVWCAAYVTVLKPLEIIQKRALKIALNVPRLTPTDVLFKLANVQRLASINKIQTAIFMYKYNNDLLPGSFDNKFECNNDYHVYSTRISSLHHVPMIRLERTKLSLSYRGVKVWNSINDDVKNVSSLNAFKNAIKKLCIS